MTGTTDREARTGSVLRLALPRGRGWTKAVAAGVLSALCGVALLAASGYLITRAAEHPPILYLTLVMVGVRAFALGRAVSATSTGWPGTTPRSGSSPSSAPRCTDGSPRSHPPGSGRPGVAT